MQIERLAQLATEIEKTTDIESFLRLDREFHLLSYAGAKLTECSKNSWSASGTRRSIYRRAFAQLNEFADSNVTHTGAQNDC